ncbi:hypothetical protein R6Q59_025016 [Mikania micrantha]
METLMLVFLVNHMGNLIIMPCMAPNQKSPYPPPPHYKTLLLNNQGMDDM